MEIDSSSKKPRGLSDKTISSYMKSHSELDPRSQVAEGDAISFFSDNDDNQDDDQQKDPKSEELFQAYPQIKII